MTTKHVLTRAQCILIGALFASAPHAAPLTLTVNTPDGPCIILGRTPVALQPGTPNLAFPPSVELIGACGGPDYMAKVDSPSAGVVGQNYYLFWHVVAPNADTRCYYTANRPSIAAAPTWPVGTLACAGIAGPTACPIASAKRRETIQFTVPGGPYKYGVICTNTTGLTESATIDVVP